MWARERARAQRRPRRSRVPLCADMAHARGQTELEPVTLPIELSAVLSPLAAPTEAKVSGREVPSATKVIAVTESLVPIRQPIWEAKSEMSTTWPAMTTSAPTKQSQPPHRPGGGTSERIAFQGKTSA